MRLRWYTAAPAFAALARADLPMHLCDFDYHLPDALIAQAPAPERAGSRLLQLHGSGAVVHRQFRDLPDLLAPGDLLIVNDTRVIPARLLAVKDSGGRVELLLERLLGANVALAQVRSSKALVAGRWIAVQDGAATVRVLVGERHDDLYELVFPEPVLTVLARCGHVPLPPYIRRPDTGADVERYQTVFAQRPGAVAAPTAGLHFDAPTLAALAAKGIEREAITLHVGAGTFAPVRTADVDAHRMHAEWCEVSAATVAAVARCRARGGRVVAVGTTVVRALETAAADGALLPYSADTRLFIRPGFEFRVVDALLTNFHVPQSTLLMLVCAFAGRQAVLDAYRAAVDEKYRFFSYGDAMFLTRRQEQHS